MEWFCDFQMPNGIKYKSFDEKNLSNSVMIKKPLGIAVVGGEG